MRCAIGGHAPQAGETYNSGYFFSACGRCGCPLIRSGSSEWGTVPSGHRVVWKSGRHSHSIAADFEGVLPILVREDRLPAVPSPFLSWSRSLVRLPRLAAANAQPRCLEEPAEDYRYPGLLLIAVAVGAGLRFLLGLGMER